MYVSNNGNIDFREAMQCKWGKIQNSGLQPETRQLGVMK